MPGPSSTEAHHKVLEAAAQMFADQGIDSTSMDAILAASGVSKATNSFGIGREHKLNHLCGAFRGLRQQMDVRFCEEQEPPAEGHSLSYWDTLITPVCGLS